jgi:glutamate/tyrosine decarboxylase-like PLP-dependent enzyme
LPDDPLSLDPETMRALGYRTVDLLVDWLGDTSAPPLRRADPEEMRARLSGPAPERPEAFDEILAGLVRDVLPFMSRSGHPGFFAFTPFNGTWPGALGDFVASACNVYAGSWMEGAGPSQVELEVLGWFKDWLGCPPEAAGSLVSGGSAANMTALACAREARAGAMSDRLVAYCSDQAHSSVARGARVLGFRPEQVRVLPSDAAFRLDPTALAAAIDADARAGRTPLFVAAAAGSTNTGAVDPLPELGALCRERGVWLHVDAAYGGFAALTERGRAALAGIADADSVTLDPHKWLYQPYECGCLLVRDGRLLRTAFEVRPDYLVDAAVHDGEVNFGDLGLQLSRASRALKLWVSLRFFGVDAFRAAIDRTLDLAELAGRRIGESASLELAAPPSLGVVCFRRRGLDEQGHAGLLAALERSGFAFASSTRLRGELVLRLCVLNHTTRAEHVERVLGFLEREAPDPASVPAYERDPDVLEGWLGGAGVEARALRRLPLFEALSAEEAERAAALAERTLVEAGATVVRQWSTGRDFFVIVEGTAEAEVDGTWVRELGPGDFFGELAALEWEAGFGYPRLATVRATSPLSLLVFPEGRLNALVEAFPSVEREIRAAVRARLHG